MTQVKMQTEWIAKQNEDTALRKLEIEYRRRDFVDTTDRDDVPMP